MKNQFKPTPRSAFVAAVIGAISCAGMTLAQEQAPKQTAPQSVPGGDATTTTSAEPTATPVSSMAAVGQKPRKSDAAKNNANTKAVGAAALASADQQFLMMAGKGNQMEIHMGQMAAKQGQSAEVKKLGGQIASDHTKANSQLTDIATKKGVKLNADQMMDKVDKQLTSKEGMAKFDQEWLMMMTKDHQKDIAMYEKEAKMGGDAEVKGYASKTLPVLKKHLAMVKDAQDKMMKKG